MDNAAVKDLFLRALELSPGQREAFLAADTAPPEVRDEVRSLLRYESGSETFLKQSIASEQPPVTGTGARFGVYELQELLGRGGMGAVYRAERSDRELRQVVAIKIIERAWLDPRAVERFRGERQILAGLVHPNIARLLDGGTRDDGIPYLVMEYVEGLRIDEYCALQGLGIAGRLRIFLPLCAAVDYAHQKLVVHRDLKPSNVLVTPGGEPKLLDFGIAKVLDSGTSSSTQTLVLTPDFSSPEQVRGEEVTTATDVYGLGAVLYHLLTGEPPHQVAGLSPLELDRAICQTPPVRPSLHRRELAGDLDNILLKALHLEPGRRYRSAHELATDIERYLERRPVRATPDGWGYRGRKFVQRHAIASSAAALAILAVAGTTGISLYEAQRARHRFAQVRELAGRFIFDFEKSIRDVPGTLPARQMVAATARQYLTSLANDAERDNGLKRELAEAHYRLSRVEIDSGQSQAAKQDLEQSVQLLRSVKADCCGPTADRLVYIRALADLARQNLVSGNIAGASAVSAEALQRSRDWVAEAQTGQEPQLALMLALATRGVVLHQSGKLSEARQTLTDANERGEKLIESAPEDAELAYEHARATHFLAEVCLLLKDGTATNEYGTRATETLTRLVKKHPGNARWRTMWAMAASTRAAGLGLLADRNPALRSRAIDAARQACDFAQENAALNPSGRNETDNAATLAARLAGQLRKAGRMNEAVQVYRESGETIDRMIAADPRNLRNRRMQATNRALMGEVLIDAGRWNEASAPLAEAENTIGQLLLEDPGNAIMLDLQLSTFTLQVVVLRHQGRVAEARERCTLGLDVAITLLRRDPSIEPSIDDLPKLRKQAHELGVADPTQTGASAQSPPKGL